MHLEIEQQMSSLLISPAKTVLIRCSPPLDQAMRQCQAQGRSSAGSGLQGFLRPARMSRNLNSAARRELDSIAVLSPHGGIFGRQQDRSPNNPVIAFQGEARIAANSIQIEQQALALWWGWSCQYRTAVMSPARSLRCGLCAASRHA